MAAQDGRIHNGQHAATQERSSDGRFGNDGPIVFADVPQISRLSQRILEANKFSTDLETAYRELIQAVVRDLRPLPGTSAVLDAFSERFSHCHIWLKARDSDPTVSIGGGLGNLTDYERISNLHFKYGTALLKYVDGLDERQTTRLRVAWDTIEEVMHMIDRNPDMDEAIKVGLKQDLARHVEMTVT